MQSEKIISERTSLIDLIHKLTYEFLIADSTDVDKVIVNALAMTSEFAQADRAYLAQITSNDKTIEITHEWCKPGVVSYKNYFKSLALEEFPEFVVMLKDGVIIDINTNDIPVKKNTKPIIKLLLQVKTEHLVLIPILTQEKLFGYIVYDQINQATAWDEESINLFKLTSQVLASALIRKNTEEKLKNLNYELIQHNKNLQQFAFITSHNLRAPVANILGLVGLYNQNDPIDPINKIVIENLYKAANNIDTIVKDLNQVVTIKSGVNEIKEKIKWEDAVSRVILSLQKQIEQSKAKIYLDFHKATYIYSVKSYIDTIFHILISNSVKYKADMFFYRLSADFDNQITIFCFILNGI